METFKEWFRKRVMDDLDNGINKYQTIHHRNLTFYEVLDIYIKEISCNFTRYYCAREASIKDIKESFNDYFEQEIDI